MTKYFGYRIYNGNNIKYISKELRPNEYAIIQNSSGKAVDYFKWYGKEIRRISPFPSIKTNYNGVVKPRNQEQYCAIDMLNDPAKLVKVLSGTHGAGKDVLMVNAALSYIQKGVVEKIFYVRNNIEVKDTVPLGSLPGEKAEKIRPWLAPLSDHVGGWDGLDHLTLEGTVEAEHLGYLRSRDIRNSIILVSEAENLTTKHIQLLLGRVGDGSQLWINGDYRQTDKKIFKDDSGMLKLIEKLADHPLVGYVHLPKTERSSVARLADLLD